MFNQRTVQKEIRFSGVGLHSGKIANVSLLPAEIDSGITIRRKDITNKNNEIKANFANVSEVFYSTKLQNEYGVCVNTVEHLMAAIWAMKISNLIIEIDAEEMPILDGCAQGFTFLIEAIGIKKQEKIRKTAKIIKEVEIAYDDGRLVKVAPCSDFIASFNLKSEFGGICAGSHTFEFSRHSFINDISLARTYCQISEVETLKSKGLAAGGSLDNALVLDGNKVLNKNGANYQDECVRHKIMDLIGDIALCDYFILGHFTGNNSGHELNNKLMRKIFSDEANFVIL
ncbi:UDP-3-O-acyl-N-acetylglucosamine deacetylase [Candidatus Deianiraea vastatrix]|uniref:UDP-3-O-acyl-N-acetylglucosamine deacetylase n=1 Tax=Candidatus Deianiraea vastatrix TaxID=2163644 RepID=A0A5B8XCP2_9RICK|nr:UDP-3-O-acyl-N-acetylglucosamine deacetylase [Candidatus Deianiraea vastatrix]QED23128.1 UDP-3-O-[3-hydroxymyristoyl] N-acetylglucosamine deacetylase [Candidatus Deianiraea vastatrix]